MSSASLHCNPAHCIVDCFCTCVFEQGSNLVLLRTIFLTLEVPKVLQFHFRFNFSEEIFNLRFFPVVQTSVFRPGVTLANFGHLHANQRGPCNKVGLVPLLGLFSSLILIKPLLAIPFPLVHRPTFWQSRIGYWWGCCRSGLFRCSSGFRR